LLLLLVPEIALAEQGDGAHAGAVGARLDVDDGLPGELARYGEGVRGLSALQAQAPQLGAHTVVKRGR
jgi:hypothetical protein